MSEMQSFKTVVESQEPFILLARLTGATVGSFISIAYILPHGRQEAVLRMLVGIGIGLVFGGSVGYNLAHTFGVFHDISPAETVLIGSALASLTAWWALGALQRLAQSWSGAGRDK